MSEPIDYDDLCKRLRNGFPDVYEWEQAADAIAALREQVAALQLVVRDDAKWAQENEFLHKRRGELVIERDRYKAALGEYPEGRDVILAGTLAALEKAEADNTALRKDAVAIFKWLNRKGGLGYDVHNRIDTFLAMYDAALLAGKEKKTE